MSRIDWRGLRAAYSLAMVAGRSGVHLGADSGDVVICCPMPGHDDKTPSMVLHLDSDRYYCFGCGAHGDVIQWVQDLQGVSAVEAVRILDGDCVVGSAVGRPRDIDPWQRESSTEPPKVRRERPDLDRTCVKRVREVLEAAWGCYTSRALHRLGADYLVRRHLDITALESEIGTAVVGHTPGGAAGLVSYLQARGFSGDELVDASLASRYPDGRCIDFFRHRAMFPVGDDHGRLAGLVGRTTTTSRGPKYLNMSKTQTYDKAIALYRPSRSPLERDASVVVCEGTIDALAIAAQAATSGLSNRYAPVAPSGLAISDHQFQRILAIHPLPPVFSGDGDTSGRRATVEWATRAALAGRESVVTTWPDGHDPASWIVAHGEEGLLAVTRKGCLDAANTGLRPRHAGEIIALAAFADATSRSASLSEGLRMALSPHVRLRAAAADRYVIAVARTTAPIIVAAELTLGADGGRVAELRDRLVAWNCTFPEVGQLPFAESCSQVLRARNMDAAESLRHQLMSGFLSRADAEIGGQRRTRTPSVSGPAAGRWTSPRPVGPGTGLITMQVEGGRLDAEKGPWSRPAYERECRVFLNANRRAFVGFLSGTCGEGGE
jgi:DNA primase